MSFLILHSIISLRLLARRMMPAHNDDPQRTGITGQHNYTWLSSFAQLIPSMFSALIFRLFSLEGLKWFTLYTFMFLDQTKIVHLLSFFCFFSFTFWPAQVYKFAIRAIIKGCMHMIGILPERLFFPQFTQGDAAWIPTAPVMPPPQPMACKSAALPKNEGGKEVRQVL